MQTGQNRLVDSEYLKGAYRLKTATLPTITMDNNHNELVWLQDLMYSKNQLKSEC